MPVSLPSFGYTRDHSTPPMCWLCFFLPTLYYLIFVSQPISKNSRFVHFTNGCRRILECLRTKDKRFLIPKRRRMYQRSSTLRPRTQHMDRPRPGHPIPRRPHAANNHITPQTRTRPQHPNDQRYRQSTLCSSTETCISCCFTRFEYVQSLAFLL